MKAITALLFITLVVSVDANPFSAYFNNIVDTIMGRKTEKAKDELQLAKEHALMAWSEAGSAIEDLGSATWDKLYDGYEKAWTTLSTSRQKIFDKVKSAKNEIEKEWNTALGDVKGAVSKIAAFFESYKDKIEEKTSDAFFTALEKVETTAKTARTKFGTTRDKVATYYDEVHDEAIDDYNTAAKNFHDATERVKKYAERKADKNFEATKKKLDAARDKAKDYYAESKKNLAAAKTSGEKWNSEIKEYFEEYAKSSKARATEALDSLNSYKNNAEHKAKKEYQSVLHQLQKANDRAIAGAQEAELNAQYLEKRLSRKASNILEDIKLKYQSLKDEL